MTKTGERIIESADAEEEDWPNIIHGRVDIGEYSKARDRIQELEAENEAECMALSKEIIALREGLERYIDATNTYVNELSGVHAGTHCIVPVEPTDEQLQAISEAFRIAWWAADNNSRRDAYNALLKASKETE